MTGKALGEWIMKVGNIRPHSARFQPIRRLEISLKGNKSSCKTNSSFIIKSNKWCILVLALHKQVEPQQSALVSAQSTGRLTSDAKGLESADPLAKSLVKINQELSRIIQTMGSNQSASSTPVPGTNTPGKAVCVRKIYNCGFYSRLYTTGYSLVMERVHGIYYSILCDLFFICALYTLTVKATKCFYLVHPQEHFKEYVCCVAVEWCTHVDISTIYV